MARRYRRPRNDYYDIGFLNDLHHHFPALLYNIDRFMTVQDVLLYIRTMAASRYNLFENAQDDYNNTYMPMLQPQQQQPLPSQRQRHHVSGGATGRLFASRQGGQTAAAAAPRFPARGHFHYRAQTEHIAPPPAPNPRRTDHIRTQRYPTINTPITSFNDFTTLGFSGLTQPLTTFTTFPLTPPTTTQDEIDGATALLTLLGLATTPNTLFPNLTPVVVRPTQDIINHATVAETIQEPIPNSICVICQDEYTLGNSVRRIRHCQHFFHNDCIMQHFNTSVRCPTCRHDIRDFLSAAATETTE